MVHQEGLTDNSYHGADFEGWIVSAGNGTITAEDGKMSELWSARGIVSFVSVAVYLKTWIRLISWMNLNGKIQ